MIFVYHVLKENLHCGKFIEPRFKMKMDIVESDLKRLLMWMKKHEANLKCIQELYKSQQVLIEVLDERLSNIELLLTQEDNK